MKSESHGKLGLPFAIAVAVILLVGPAQAVGYSEGTSGDLSSDASSPTNIGNLTLGGNTIIGATDPSGPVVDPMTGARADQDNDYVTFSVPTGEVLSKIVVGNDSIFQSGDRMFFGIAQGNNVSVDPSFSSASGLLGWTLVGNPQLGSDVLPLLGASAPANFPAIPGATGFSGSLSAGTYTLWLLDGDQPASYDLDLIVASVPEVSTWISLLVGFALLGTLVRWHGSQKLGTAV